MEKVPIKAKKGKGNKENDDDEPTDFSFMGQYGYTLFNKLGSGSVAKVYRAEHHNPQGNEELACKVIDTTTTVAGYKEFHLPRELEIIRKFSHPSIIKFHSLVQVDDVYFVFLEHAARGDLADMVVNEGVVAEGQAQVWTRQVAEGIQYLHEHDVCHRDLKCDNVLITAELRAKITDFGCGRFLTDKKGRSVSSTTYCGSLLYMAPEVVRHAPYYPKSADVWGLGVLLFVCTNGIFPFPAHNAKDLYDMQMKRQWFFNPVIADSLSDQLKAFIRRLLHPNTFKRPKIEDVLLDAWVTPNKPKAEPPPEPQKVRPSTRKTRTRSKFHGNPKMPMTL